MVARPEGPVMWLGSLVAAVSDTSQFPYLIGASFRRAPVGAGLLCPHLELSLSGVAIRLLKGFLLQLLLLHVS